MAAATGVILATGAIVLTNQVLVEGKTINFKVPLAIGFAALGLGLLATVAPSIADMIAWMALVTALITPVGSSKSPVEAILTYSGFE